MWQSRTPATLRPVCIGSNKSDYFRPTATDDLLGMGSAAAGGGGLDMQSILANVGGGGVGGAILMAVIGIIKSQMSKQ